MSGYGINQEALYKLKHMRNKLGRFTKQVNEHPIEVLNEEASRMNEEAKMLVPLDTGQLQSSITTVVDRESKLKVSLRMSASAEHNGYDYAGIQHDNPWYEHAPGRQWHYIKEPFEEGIQRIEERLEKEIGYDR